MSTVRRLWEANRLTILLVGALVGGYLLLRTSPSDIGSVDELMGLVRSRDATVLYFYSNT